MIYHGKGVRILKKTGSCIFDPAFFGAPKIEEGIIVFLCQPGVFIGMEKTFGQMPGLGMGTMDLQVDPQRVGAESADPPVSAVSNRKMKAGQSGEIRFAPTALLNVPQFIIRQTAIQTGGLTKEAPGTGASF